MTETRAPASSVWRLADLVEAALDQIELDQAHATDRVRVAQSGLKELDVALGGGLRPGQLVVLAGRPGTGAATLARNIAIHAAAEQRIPSLLVVPWTTGHDVTRHLLAAAGRIPVHHLLAGDLHEEDWDKLGRAVGVLSSAPLYVASTRGQGPEMVERAASDVGRSLGLVVVDSLPALLPSFSRMDQPSQVARELKQLAMRRNFAVLVTAGLLPAPESRGTSVPQIADLRGTGDLDEVADVVVLLHREELTDHDSLRPGEADLLLAKNVNGDTRTVTALFQGHYSRFVDMMSS